MSYTVRKARTDDTPGIAEWTQDTFTWGDYVAGSIANWIDDPARHVLVATDDSDVPRAVSVVRMLSPTEGWLSSARVHPDQQRQGLGTLLNDASVGWIRERGGRVARLVTEDVNEPAKAQVEKLGYRNTSTWVYAEVVPGSGMQSFGKEKLNLAGRADVDPAWMYWSTSGMYETGRGLKPSGWAWRRARVDDLNDAAGEQRLFHHPAGWVILEYPPDEVDVTWVATSPNDFPRLVAAVDLHAVERGVERVNYHVPETGWSGEALRRAGGSVSDVLIWAKAV